MKIKDIAEILEQAAPLAIAESYDNSGLLVGDREADVDSVLLCVDITEQVLDEAIELGAGLIVSHHPVIFNPLKHITGETYIERVVAKAIINGVALYACHTNLDSATDGLSRRLGNLLGLKNVSVLSPGNSAYPGTGLGVVGELPTPMSAVEYLRLVKKILNLDVVRYSAITRPEIRRVAICTGAGASLTGDAKAAGAELYISADFKYNNFLDADRELVIADIGHYESEYCAIDVLYEIIRKKIPTFALHKSKYSINPVNYLV